MQEEYRAEVEAHFNEPILLRSNLCRCIGYGEDDTDCYIIGNHPGRGIVRHTFIGGYVYLDRLKGQASAGDWDDFTRLDSILELNGAPRESAFICEDRNSSASDAAAAKTKKGQ